MILGVPSIAALTAGAVSGMFVDAVAAVALVLPVTLASHAVTQWWARRNPAGAFLGMLAGVIARAAVIVGGGAALYLLTDWFEPRGVALWVWVIGVYVVTLTVELGLLVRSRSTQGSAR